jgi:hypothetical protein
MLIALVFSVGLDVQSSYTPLYVGGNKYQSSWSEQDTSDTKQTPNIPKTSAKKTTQGKE